MSEDMRKMIDKLKNFKEFVNESIGNNESQIWFHISPTENRNSILTNGLATTNKKDMEIYQKTQFIYGNLRNSLCGMH